ncbi:MAG: MBL fold metallo-hydrolase [Bacteriovorax sp.]|nr:MBL fold metallo-hydrolase [Bacteriovorax sp.]
MDSNNLNSVTALGTGTSTGIPMIGCHCPVCTSLDHRDQRLRTSILLQTVNGKKILVDTTPDLRTQFLNNKISDIDFVIMTHDHADHLHGIDDLRPLCFGPPVREINLYCNEVTHKVVEKRFDYIFGAKDLTNKPILGGGIPRLKLNTVPLLVETTISGESFFFFNYPHGHGETMGFLHQGFAYIVDCMEIPDELMTILKKKKIDLLILDCLQRSKHSTHLTVDRAFSYIEEIKPNRTGLIHMGHDLFHLDLMKMAKVQFGPSVFPLYDQQKLFY